MILVVGAGRTGTTLVARVLQEHLGVSMGGPGRRHATNPTGDYEDREIRRINRQYLRRTIELEEWRSEFADVVAERVEPWGFKDPSSCFFLPDILAMLPGAQVIWAKRDLEATVSSWVRNYHQEAGYALDSIKQRLGVLHLALRDVPHVCVDTSRHWEETELAEWLRDLLGGAQ